MFNIERAANVYANSRHQYYLEESEHFEVPMYIFIKNCFKDGYKQGVESVLPYRDIYSHKETFIDWMVREHGDIVAEYLSNQ